MACACCKAAWVLHKAKIVHRDFRMANIVQLGFRAYMVIDLETVGKRKAGPIPTGFSLTGWRSTTLTADRRYNTLSDMHQIGLMLDEQLQQIVGQPSENARDFVQKLLDKKLSARRALRHPWIC